MKKLLMIVSALLLMGPVNVLAGMTAFMEMDELSSHEMAGTTGQAGITLVSSGQIVTGGYISWGDDDGCTTTVNATNQGWLTLSSIWSTGSLTTATVDVCSNTSGDQWLVVRVPLMLVNRGIRAIKVGSVANTGASLGELQIVNVVLSNMTLQVRGH